MKYLVLTLVLLTFTLPAFSQTSAKTENIRKLLELTGSGKLGVQVGQSLLTSFKKIYPSVPNEIWDNFMKEMNSETLISLVIPIYDKHYTESEIKQLTDFYQTPIGKKVIETTPLISQESMLVGQKWGKELAEKLYKELDEKGLIKKEE